MSGHDVVEVHLEELGQHSWVKALLNSLSYGSAQFRFVARPPTKEHRPGDHVATGATFPVLRWQDLNDQRSPNAWLEIAQERLEELDAELRGRGWRRGPEEGDHWWSRTYVAS